MKTPSGLKVTEKNVRLKSMSSLREFLAAVVKLPRVASVVVTPAGVAVSRILKEDEEEDVLTAGLLSLVEEGGDIPDLEFILGRIQVQELAFSAERHVLHTLIGAFEQLKDLGTEPVLIYTLHGDGLAAALGLPEGHAPETLFGHRVVYVQGGLEEGRLLILGAPTGLVLDATHGVVADLLGGAS